MKIEIYPDDDVVAGKGAAIITAEMRAVASLRGYTLARGVDTALGYFRTPDTGLSGQRAAARYDRARRSGARHRRRYMGRSGRVTGMKTFARQPRSKNFNENSASSTERVTEIARNCLARLRREELKRHPSMGL